MKVERFTNIGIIIVCVLSIIVMAYYEFTDIKIDTGTTAVAVIKNEGKFYRSFNRGSYRPHETAVIVPTTHTFLAQEGILKLKNGDLWEVKASIWYKIDKSAIVETLNKCEGDLKKDTAKKLHECVIDSLELNKNFYREVIRTFGENGYIVLNANIEAKKLN